MSEEEIEVAEVTQFATANPELLKVMVEATILLEKLVRGELTLSEAKAIYENKIRAVVESLIEKSKPKRSTKSKAAKSKRTTRRRKSKA